VHTGLPVGCVLVVLICKGISIVFFGYDNNHVLAQLVASDAEETRYLRVLPSARRRSPDLLFQPYGQRKPQRDPLCSMVNIGDEDSEYQSYTISLALAWLSG